MAAAPPLESRLIPKPCCRPVSWHCNPLPRAMRPDQECGGVGLAPLADPTPTAKRLAQDSGFCAGTRSAHLMQASAYLGCKTGLQIGRDPYLRGPNQCTTNITYVTRIPRSR